MSILEIADYFIIYGTYLCLLFFAYLFISNFSGHFKFNYQCPWIVKDEEVSGIYPTLLNFYLLIALLISCFISYSTYDDELRSAHSTFQYKTCYLRFQPVSNDLLASNFIDDGNHLLILWSLSILFLLETYFSYTRYYSCLSMAKRLNTPSRLRTFVPYTVYIVSVLLLIWCTVSVLPILMLLLCILHFLINTYFSYFFYVSVKLSYLQVLQCYKDVTFVSEIYEQMQQQISQIRSIYILATCSAFISGFVNVSFTLCGTLRLVPFGLLLNSLCIYLMFTKNRHFLRSTVYCRCGTLHDSLKEPFTILKKRRESPWSPPTALDRLKTSSAASLRSFRDLPKQLTPHFLRSRTRSASNHKSAAVPPNTPRLPGLDSETNLDIIEEENEFENKYPDISINTQSSTTNLAKPGGADNHKDEKNHHHLKPGFYPSQPLPSETSHASKTSSVPHSPFSPSSESTDTIAADEDMMILPTSQPPLPHRIPFKPVAIDPTPVYKNEQDILVTPAEIDRTVADPAALFERMSNLRATMHQDNIEELRLELSADAVLEDNVDNDEDEDEDEIRYHETELQPYQRRMSDAKEQDEKRFSLEEKHKRKSQHEKHVEAIEIAKQELEKERKVLELKKKTTKRIAFGADIALDIIQQSIVEEEAKEKQAKHEYQVQQLYHVSTRQRHASSAHALTAKAPINTPKGSLHRNPIAEEPQEVDSDIFVVYAEDDEKQKQAVSDHEHLVDDNDDDTELPAKGTSMAYGKHLRSQSDDKMIHDIAHQMAMHAKQVKRMSTSKRMSVAAANKKKLKNRVRIGKQTKVEHTENPRTSDSYDNLQKTPFQHTLSLNQQGEASNHQNSKHMTIAVTAMPRLKLHLQSASDNVDKMQNQSRKVKFAPEIAGDTHSAKRAAKKDHLKPVVHHANDPRDVYDIYDDLRGIERTPSPPPGMFFDGKTHPKHNNTLDLNEFEDSQMSKTNSVFQTLRSWISPFSLTEKTDSIGSSNHAVNINSFLQTAGFTTRSAKIDDLVDIMPAISESAHDQQELEIFDDAMLYNGDMVDVDYGSGLYDDEQDEQPDKIDIVTIPDEMHTEDTKSTHRGPSPERELSTAL